NSQNPCAAGASPYYECIFDEHQQLAAIELTPEGERLARDLDRRFIQENRVGFDDRTDDWTIHGKMKLSGLTLGLDLTRTSEGLASTYTDLFVDGGSVSAGRDTTLYLKYSRPVGRDLTLNTFTRYHQTAVDKAGSHVRLLHMYANSSLSLWNLVSPCLAP